jgi:hypothetical protein
VDADRHHPVAELRRLAPAADLPEEDHAAAFRAIAELLLDRTVLVVAGRPHRFTELEVYFDGPAHPDPFTHGDPRQREMARWYFHRVGGTYKGGTYKGVDIAFGRADACAGVLVRGIAELGEPAQLVDGPCLVVDRLLALTGRASVADLADRIDLAIDAPDSPVRVEAAAARGARVYASPRIGLTLKKGATPARVAYLSRAYRFLTEPARIKKGRALLVGALHREGYAIDDIARLLACRPAVVAGHLQTT